jgi:glucokinase
VDLGGTFMKLALLDPAGRIAANERMPTAGVEGHDAVLARMAEAILRLAAGAPAGRLGGVGVGVPGMVEMATGVTGDLPNLPGRWHGVAVGPELAAATGLPVRLINDARAFALAESRLGPPAAPRPPSASRLERASEGPSSPSAGCSLGSAAPRARSAT